MKTKIRDLLHTKPASIVSVKPDNSVHEAIQTMVNHNIGSVLVINEEQELLGIFTERDILKQCVRRSDQLKTTKVDSVMTTDLIIAFPDDTVEYLISIMTTNKIRHIPILMDNKILGVVSIGDLVKSQMKDIEIENHYLKDYITGRYPG